MFVVYTDKNTDHVRMTVPRICNNTYYRPLFPVVDVSMIEKFSGIASIEYIVKLVDSICNIYYYVVHIVGKLVYLR